MTIRFACPSGHKLSCPDERAGQAAKCPHCGVRFRVPKSSTVDGAKEEIVVFLCPQGHKLHGPKRLAGRGGQCPHCGEKFQIPTEEELSGIDMPSEEDGAASQEAPVETADPGATDVATEEPPPETEQLEEIEEVGGAEGEYTLGEPEEGMAADDEVYEVTDVEIVDEDDGEAHPVYHTFSWLWDQREDGAKIELHLNNGEKIQIERFASRISRGPHGVFSTKNQQGDDGLISVSWDSINRVVISPVDHLPEEMFD